MKDLMNYKFQIALLICISLLVSCSNFDELNTNPEEPTEATSTLMARSFIANMMEFDDSKQISFDYQIDKYMGYIEARTDEQYNHFKRTSFGNKYTILTTGQKMVQKAEENNDPQLESYKGLLKFMKAYNLFKLTMRVGDIPYSEALMDSIQKPKYDTQKEVFLQILNDLDEAYDYFGQADISFDGDIIYNGDNTQWQKMVSALEMKILINLSKKEDDPDLNIKDRFKDIVSNQQLFESNSDNFQLEFANEEGMVYPFHSSRSSFTNSMLLSHFFINMMKDNHDYRMFYYASPAKGIKNAQDLSNDDWKAFEGVDITASFNNMVEVASKEEVSLLNKRYIKREEGVPFAKIRYSDMNFYLAEAALRDWIGGDPNSYYLEGIAADMKFKKEYMIDDEEYNYGRVITDDYISDFIEKPEIQLSGDFEAKLKQILDQKYISNFLQVKDLDAYFDYRRTGYPDLPFDPATNQNSITDKLPDRFMYPNSESDYNTDNLQEALERQFDGDDDVNKKMWLLK